MKNDQRMILKTCAFQGLSCRIMWCLSQIMVPFPNYVDSFAKEPYNDMLLYHVILKICAFQGSSDNHSPLLSPSSTPPSFSMTVSESMSITFTFFPLKNPQ
mmetsp:Transcript_51314/g.75113  ORF Transcript_51314/g.75113 Transcript_51314/m.75113 type:complete len:101 (-) Transcript_51314:1464-1766(-)